MDKKDYIKQHLSIPKYFKAVILPDMPDYYRGDYIDFDNRPVVKCPLHSEDTASFRYFPETESFYCYGCTAGGDIIDLHKQHMLLNHNEYKKFDDMIDDLYDIAKNIGERLIKHSLEIGEAVPEINGNQDILKFNIYLNRWFSYIDRVVLDTDKKFSLISKIYTYRDGILAQKIRVNDAIAEIEKLI